MNTTFLTYNSSFTVGVLISIALAALPMLFTQGRLRELGILFLAIFFSWLVGLLFLSASDQYWAAMLVFGPYAVWHWNSIKNRDRIHAARTSYQLSNFGLHRYTDASDTLLWRELEPILQTDLSKTLILGDHAAALLGESNDFRKQLIKSARFVSGSLHIVLSDGLKSMVESELAELESEPSVTLQYSTDRLPMVLFDADQYFYFNFGNAGRGAGYFWRINKGDNRAAGLERALETYLSTAVNNDWSIPRGINVVSRADEYHSTVADLESSADRVDKLVKRMSIVFKSEDHINFIAEQRYGKNSRQYQTYVDSQMARKESFFERLERGSYEQRDICPIGGFIDHLQSPVHAGVSADTAHFSTEQARNLIDTLRKYDGRYSLGLTKSRLPFRYSIYDSSHVVMHEAVGAADLHRINSMIISDSSAVKSFQEEFDFLWSLRDESLRTNASVVAFIESQIAELQQ